MPVELPPYDDDNNDAGNGMEDGIHAEEYCKDDVFEIFQRDC